MLISVIEAEVHSICEEVFGIPWRGNVKSNV